MSDRMGKLLFAVALVFALAACEAPPDYTGTWGGRVNGEKVTTTIKADGTVTHQRGNEVFHGSWKLDDDGNLLMAEGHVVAHLEEGKLVIVENNRRAALNRIDTE